MKHIVLTIAVLGISVGAAQAQVKKSSVDGITNFAQVETTVACSGAIKPEAIPSIKKMGFVSIINLRLPTENGANVPAEAAAAKASDMKFADLPFSTSAPDPAVVDRFLQILATPGYQPAFIHCAGGGRAATMWFIKRVLVDKWAIDRATEEATQLGMTNEGLKKFALEYIQAHSH